MGNPISIFRTYLDKLHAFPHKSRLISLMAHTHYTMNQGILKDKTRYKYRQFGLTTTLDAGLIIFLENLEFDRNPILALAEGIVHAYRFPSSMHALHWNRRIQLLLQGCPHSISYLRARMPK